MGYIFFNDASAGIDQVINLEGLVDIGHTANTCVIGYNVNADGSGAQAQITITSTGNGAAIKNKFLAAIKQVDGGGSTTIDMSDTATTSSTALGGYS